MKTLLSFLGASLMAVGVLSAVPPAMTHAKCQCQSCTCAPERHCGCFSQSGCQCSSQACQCSSNCQCGYNCSCGSDCGCS